MTHANHNHNWPSRRLKFKWGDQVHRVGKTYEYPGVIVGFAYTTKGKIRYDVEATGPGYEEMLHIFSEEELELIPNPTGD